MLAVGALAGLSACTAAPAPAAPTVAAVATAASPAAATVVAAASPLATQATAASPVAATVAVAASPAVATAVTAASPAVATVVAAASPAVTAATAASPVRITNVQLSPTDTTITLQNTSNAAVDMAGWKLQVGSATAALPSGARVAPNESVTIHAGAGTSGGSDIYLGQDAAPLVAGLRPGATLSLLDAQGNPVAQFTLPG
jgi:Lamin Tail Domain